MERNKYDSQRIKHIVGQEGPIKDPEKALVMAEVEDQYRDIADMYDALCGEPGTFMENYPIMAMSVERFLELQEEDDANSEFQKKTLLSDPSVKEYLLDPELYEYDHPMNNILLAEFIKMRELGVASQYIRRVGEQLAEVRGAIEDYENSLEFKDNKTLKRDIRGRVVPIVFDLVLSAIQKDWKSDSEFIQSPEYHNTNAKSMINLRAVIESWNILRRNKQHQKLEEEMRERLTQPDENITLG